MQIHLYRNNKYGNRRAEYNGKFYHSKKEADYAAELDLRKKAGDILSWTPQHRLSLDINGHHICNYIIDFLVIDKTGEEQIHEIKGFATDLWKLKWALTEAIWGQKYKMVLIK